MDGFKTARRDIIELFQHSYSEIDEIKENFSEKCNSDLREWALEPYSDAPEYDPHSSVMAVISTFKQIQTKIKRLCTVLLFLAGILSINWIRALAIDGVDALETVKSVIPLSILSISILYLWWLRADTFAHQTLNRELRVGKMKVMSRDRSQIVGYGIWNRSLYGQTGLLLVAFFYLLRSLPQLPILGRLFDNPAQFVKAMFIQNVRMFYQTDSWFEAGKHLYRKYR